jgi:hypothetical protein
LLQAVVVVAMKAAVVQVVFELAMLVSVVELVTQ